MPERLYRCWAIAYESKDNAVAVEFGEEFSISKIGAREAASIYAERLFNEHGDEWFKVSSYTPSHVDDEYDMEPVHYFSEGKRFRYIDIGVIDTAGREWGYRVKVEGPPHAFYAGQSLW
ncbi:hypothetical protein [Azospirillum sp.]|uniref:hypothetical protein n=1 Tax=Azospirillum sp. TaxID=34012 RepID=UPI002D4E9E52|nr:hypothetical protein [Azospirillum sp.]HYF86188.1 hypothetical protein [Azospirillum sp.]